MWFGDGTIMGDGMVYISTKDTKRAYHLLFFVQFRANFNLHLQYNSDSINKFYLYKITVCQAAFVLLKTNTYETNEKIIPLANCR